MTHETRQPADPSASATGTGRGPGYEVRDTNVRAVVTFLVSLTLFVFVAQVFLWGLFRSFSRETPETELDQANPGMIHEQRQALSARETAALATIDQAIARIADRGLPVTGAGRTEAEVGSHSGIAAKPSPPPAPSPAPGETKRQGTPK